MQVQPDIISVTETWLEPSRIKTVTQPGYNFFHTDALTASPNGTGLAAGVGTYIKASINATVRDQFRLEFPGCEDLWSELPLKNGKQCYIGVIYKHPKTNVLDFQNHLSKSIEQLNKTNRKFYICGDMNINFLKVQSNSMIKQYYDCIYSLGCLSLIHSPTRTAFLNLGVATSKGVAKVFSGGFKVIYIILVFRQSQRIPKFSKSLQRALFNYIEASCQPIVGLPLQVLQ